MKDDPQTIHFAELDALMVAIAKAAAPDDEKEQDRIIAWNWFLLVTEPLYLEVCLETIGVSHDSR